MDRTTRTELLDSPRKERRRFLKQIATTGAMAGAAALPAWAQEKSAPPATPGVPAERVAQIHIAGHSKYRRYILDTHDHPVIDPVWKLYERAIQRVGHTATLLEWDDSIPSFDEVHDEALKANKFLSSTLLATAV